MKYEDARQIEVLGPLSAVCEMSPHAETVAFDVTVAVSVQYHVCVCLYACVLGMFGFAFMCVRVFLLCLHDWV
jgi:hypothetical protein